MACLQERYISPDDATVHIYERYVDSAAVMAHNAAFSAQFGDRFSKLVERKSIHFWGSPSVELKKMLDASLPVEGAGKGGGAYLGRLDGFSRF